MPDYSFITHQLRRVSQAILLLLIFVALPGLGAELAPGLVVVPPSNLGMDVQRLETLNGKPTLIGYADGRPAYFVAAEPVADGGSTGILWARLEAGLRSDSDSGQLRRAGEGRYETLQGYTIAYRLYEYTKGGQLQTQAYHLLKGGRGGYWFYVTAVDGVNLQGLAPLVEAVLRRAVVGSASSPASPQP